MPKRKPSSEEEEDVEEDELADDSPDYAESGDEKPFAGPAAGSSRTSTRKKTKSIKAEVGSDEDEPLAKKPKTELGDRKDTSPSRSDIVVKSTSDGDKYIELGKKKRVTVRVFKGTPLIDIREFYTDAGGVDKPGKKGLSLGLDQWETLKKSSTTIDELLATLKKK